MPCPSGSGVLLPYRLPCLCLISPHGFYSWSLSDDLFTCGACGFSLSGAGRFHLLQAPRSSFTLRSPQYLVAVASRCSSTSSSFLGRLGNPPCSRRHPSSASPSRASERVRFTSPTPSSTLLSPFASAPTYCFRRLLSFPSVCPPLAFFWPSLHSCFFFSLLCDSVESQFLRDGVLPPGRVSSVGVFVNSFPWFHFLSTSLGVFLVCSDFSPYFSQGVGYYLLRGVFLAVSILLLVAVWLSRLRLVCFCSSL